MPVYEELTESEYIEELRLDLGLQPENTISDLIEALEEEEAAGADDDSQDEED